MENSPFIDDGISQMAMGKNDHPLEGHPHHWRNAKCSFTEGDEYGLNTKRSILYPISMVVPWFGIRPGCFLLNCGEKVQVHMQYPWLHPFLVWSIMICGGFKEVLVQYYGNKRAPGPKCSIYIYIIYIYNYIYVISTRSIVCKNASDM